MLITKQSQFTGKTYTREIDITPEEYDRYLAIGGHVQIVFPQLSAEDREFLHTGCTPEEWDSFGLRDELDAE